MLSCEKDLERARFIQTFYGERRARRVGRTDPSVGISFPKICLVVVTGG